MQRARMEARGVMKMELKEKKDVVPDSAYKAALQRSVERYGPSLDGSPLMKEHREFVRSMNGTAGKVLNLKLLSSQQPMK